MFKASKIILTFLVIFVNNILYSATQEIEMLKQELINGDYESKVEVIKKLKEMGSLSISVLIDTLQDKDPKIRSEIAHALSTIKDEKVIVPLINLLDDDDSFVRQAAVFALGMQKDKRAIEPLINKIQDEEDVKVRQEIIRALGRIGDKKATSVLIDALKDKEVRIRRAAAEAFINIEDEEASEVLINMLKDEDKIVRFFSLKALNNFYSKGIINKQKIIKALLEALNDNYWKNRCIVVNILSKTKDKQVIEPIIKSLKNECVNNINLLKKEPHKCNFSPSIVETVLWQYVCALKYLGTITVPFLFKVIEDDNKEFKYHVAITLAFMGEKNICSVLVEALQFSDNGLLRSKAAEFLGKFNYKDAIPVLKKALQDEYCTGKGHYKVRASAAKALEALGLKVKRDGNEYKIIEE